MKKKQISILIACLVPVLLLLVFGIIGMSHHLDASIHIFANLNECALIATAQNEDGSFSKYTDTVSDKDASGLAYTDFFAGEYTCGTYEFEIFAYQFDNEDSAQEYFERATGKNSEGVDSNFSLSSGLIKTRLVVFDKNRAYTVRMPTGDVDDVTQFLAAIFSVKIN